jgi:hypothetical protein
MFEASLAHPQETLHKQHLVFCVRVMSFGCARIGVKHSNPGAASASRWFHSTVMHGQQIIKFVQNLFYVFCTIDPKMNIGGRSVLPRYQYNIYHTVSGIINLTQPDK